VSKIRDAKDAQDELHELFEGDTEEMEEEIRKELENLVLED